jgi:hypothetical protein
MMQGHAYNSKLYSTVRVYILNINLELLYMVVTSVYCCQLRLPTDHGAPSDSPAAHDWALG